MSILQNGFVENDAYHPALKCRPQPSCCQASQHLPRTVIVINEPDLKIPGISKPKEFCRAIVSAIDGMLDAEKDIQRVVGIPDLAQETGTKSNLINFTATFSFGMCTALTLFQAVSWNDEACDGTKPALGQAQTCFSLMSSADAGASESYVGPRGVPPRALDLPRRPLDTQPRTTWRKSTGPGGRNMSLNKGLF